MPNYKQTEISGESWVRSPRVEILNPFLSPNPTIQFAEEKLCNFVDGSVIKEPVLNLSPYEQIIEEFTAETASIEFPILDQAGNETGQTATFSDVYRLLSSLYIFAANRRDERYAAMLERVRLEQEAMNADMNFNPDLIPPSE